MEYSLQLAASVISLVINLVCTKIILKKKTAVQWIQMETAQNVQGNVSGVNITMHLLF
jgi:hypothetical protein